MDNKYKYVLSSLVIWKILTKAQMEKKNCPIIPNVCKVVDKCKCVNWHKHLGKQFGIT